MSMGFKEKRLYYKCDKCGWSKNFIKGFYTSCEVCNEAISLEYNIDLNNTLNLSGKSAGVWRYSSLLPDFSQKTTLGEGGTFLSKAKRLRQVFKLKNLFIKDERTNPTGAFTDRGAALVAAAALHYGFRELWSFTGGDIAASLAAYAAASGLKLTVNFEDHPQIEKLYQVVFFGGEVRRFKKAKASAYNVTPKDPFLVEGYKTIAFELFEDLSEVDVVVIPVGHGVLAFSVWKGFNELKRFGFIEKLPRIVGVQASGCKPIVDAFEMGLEKPVECKECYTIARELLVKYPLRGKDVLKALRDSRGYAVAVDDADIVDSLRMLAKYEGLLVETASAAVVAGLKKLLEEKIVDRDEVVVLIATGAGIKHPQTLLRILEMDDRKTLPHIGKTSLRILSLLSENESHGYAIWRWLAEKYNISKPAVYYHLKRLEELGLIRKLSFPDRKIYVITEKGLKVVKKLKSR